MTETDCAAVASAMAEIGGMITGRVPDRAAALYRQLAALLLVAVVDTDEPRGKLQPAEITLVQDRFDEVLAIIIVDDRELWERIAGRFARVLPSPSRHAQERATAIIARISSI
jgi:hypothetical protein